MNDFDATGLIGEIMRFYVRNRGVAETLEGLSRWRLHQERVWRTVQDVQSALDRLVEEGFLVAEAHGERTLFRINPARREELPHEFGGTQDTASGSCRTGTSRT